MNAAKTQEVKAQHSQTQESQQEQQDQDTEPVKIILSLQNIIIGVVKNQREDSRQDKDNNGDSIIDNGKTVLGEAV